MSQTRLELGQTSFQSSKGTFQLTGEASAIFTSANWQPADEPFPGANDEVIIVADHWIPRTSRFRVELRVFCNDVACLSMDDWDSALALVKYGTITARFWEQLHLEVLCETSHHSQGIGGTMATWVFSFRDLEEKRKLLVDTKGLSGDQDIHNLRPPVSIPSYEFTRLNILLHFDKRVARRMRRDQVESNSRSAFVDLTDTAVRSYISGAPSRISGIKRDRLLHVTPLASIAPAIFMRGYAESLASRIRLVEPLVEALLTYSRCRKREIFDLHDNIAYDNASSRDVEQERLSVSANIWVTMSNALKRQNMKHFKAAEKTSSGKEVNAEVESQSFITPFEELTLSPQLSGFEEDVLFRIQDQPDHDILFDLSDATRNDQFTANAHVELPELTGRYGPKINDREPVCRSSDNLVLHRRVSAIDTAICDSEDVDQCFRALEDSVTSHECLMDPSGLVEGRDFGTMELNMCLDEVACTKQEEVVFMQSSDTVSGYISSGECMIELDADPSYFQKRGQTLEMEGAGGSRTWHCGMGFESDTDTGMILDQIERSGRLDSTETLNMLD